MGISTPKPRFDLAAFLSEKAPAKSRRKPTWQRTMPATQVEDPPKRRPSPRPRNNGGRGARAGFTLPVHIIKKGARFPRAPFSFA